MVQQCTLMYFSLAQLVKLNRRRAILTNEHSKQATDLYCQEGHFLYALIPGHTLSQDQVLLQAGKIVSSQTNKSRDGGDQTNKAPAVRSVTFMTRDNILQQLCNRMIESVCNLLTARMAPSVCCTS